MRPLNNRRPHYPDVQFQHSIDPVEPYWSAAIFLAGYFGESEMIGKEKDAWVEARAENDQLFMSRVETQLKKLMVDPKMKDKLKTFLFDCKVEVKDDEAAIQLIEKILAAK